MAHYQLFNTIQYNSIQLQKLLLCQVVTGITHLNPTARGHNEKCPCSKSHEPSLVKSTNQHSQHLLCDLQVIYHCNGAEQNACSIQHSEDQGYFGSQAIAKYSKNKKIQMITTTIAHPVAE